ncbi:retrovirus-related Pol polyprotein from transposon 17.6 [Trichonephila inaurata madagascariensis]|uniref:Retrovirus-related Pol polyprotein from transposon 17.6 n=1 Tax=Trichonephila inaurata madagascariensis TaxID=2747483 RepID=A0A8X7C853_9ARAC|nr:retrovirus-related Pol polyprotein from transposon 17.6 [Trichonephila inaurata madagascariensis]
MAFYTLMLTNIAENIRPLSSQTVKKKESNKVPFGLSRNPGVFQRYVSSIFRDLTRKGIVISYLDDLVIPAKDEKEDLEKLKIVFEAAKKYGLEIKFKKGQFLKKTIEFLCHVVENGTIKSSTAKTQAENSPNQQK